MPTGFKSCKHLQSGKVLILVVTYQGAETIEQTLESCAGRLDTVVSPVLIIDNASTDGTISRIQETELQSLEVMVLNKNVGPARAYNMGIEKARKRGAEWLFILDQDTVCGPCCLGLLLKTAHLLIEKGERVGAVCPTAKSRQFPAHVHPPYVWTDRGLAPVENLRTGLVRGPVAIDSSISSGTLYRVEALTEVKGFCEKYFIDFVDHECHMRMRRTGWSIWLDHRAEIYHRLGKTQKVTDDGLWIEHEPYRYYYMMRNMTDGYWRLGGLRAVMSLGAEAYRHIQKIRNDGAYPEETIRYIFRGACDALRGKFGRLDSRH